MNATKLLRDEFFTIFGDLDMKTVQQGKGFEAKVFQQVYQRLANAVGGTQHPTDDGEGKLGWSWEEALSQLHDVWPRSPPFTLPGLPVLLLKASVSACPVSASERP